MSYDAIEFPFQVHNDAMVLECAYLVPEGLPWGATLEVSPSQADIEPGHSVVFNCRLTLDETIIRPGCSNDEGFRLTAWRIADDADERWGSCFYFLRPRVRTKVQVLRASWFESRLTVYGVLSLDTDQNVQLADQLPLRVRLRLETIDNSGTIGTRWLSVPVQPGGSFTTSLADFSGPNPAEVRIQAWFDRTDLLASSRSNVMPVKHAVTQVIY